MNIQSKIDIKSAAQALVAGNLVVFPTETVYGLGADALNVNSVARIYSIKRRPITHPIIVHLANLSNIDFWVSELPDYFSLLVSKFVPGPITFILKKRSSLDIGYLTGNQNKIGLRIPSHEIAQKLLHEFQTLNGLGIAAPSANRFGEISNTNVKRIKKEFATDFRSGDVILDGGQSIIGIESTILDCTEATPKILRPGFITQKEIEDCLKIQISTKQNLNKQKIQTRASGMFLKHYAPRAKVTWSGIPKPGDGYVGLSNYPVPKGVIVLSLPKNSEEFAQVLYESFHLADEIGLENIFISIPDEGKLIEAIRDRVERASGFFSL